MQETIKIIKDITKFGFRQFENEVKTREYILNFLRKNKIKFDVQEFLVEIPKYERYFLIADNKKIRCHPCTFSLGYIKDKSKIHNSLIDFETLIDEPNINFNPLCKKISLPTFYKSPSLAIASRDLNKILKAKKILGFVKTKRIKKECANILVGNLYNPKNIIFTHYDSLFKGAIDNASGVGICLYFIKNNKQFLTKNLFIFSGNEELSYDWPIYWGYGYRIFEEKYLQVLLKASRILIIDSVGHTKPNLIKDKKIIKLGFPIKNLEKLKSVQLLSGNLNELMKYYHSELDSVKLIKNKFLEETFKIMSQLIR